MLIVGERVPPQIFLNASNAGPVEIQDLLPADTRFKFLIFGGDVGGRQVRVFAVAPGEHDALRCGMAEAGKPDVLTGDGAAPSSGS